MEGAVIFSFKIKRCTWEFFPFITRKHHKGQHSLHQRAIVSCKYFLSHPCLFHGRSPQALFVSSSPLTIGGPNGVKSCTIEPDAVMSFFHCSQNFLYL